MNGFGEPNMGNPSVRFDEGRESVGHWPCAFQPILSRLLYYRDKEGNGQQRTKILNHGLHGSTRIFKTAKYAKYAKASGHEKAQKSTKIQSAE
jgi:hypothetical protein